MAWQGGLFSLLSLAAASVSAVVILLAWRHRFEVGAYAFLGLLIALVGWSFTYGIQLGFETQSAQVFWQRIALILGGTIPTLWLIFAIHYTGRGQWLTRPRLGLLAIEPILFAVFTLTNSTHGLIWRQATLTPVRDSYALLLSFNTGYFLHIGYSYLLVGAGIALLVVAFIQSEFYRTQTGLLVFGTLPPLVAHIAHTVRFEWGPLPALDPTPILFGLTGVCFGLVQFDLIDRVPVARAHALDETTDGFIVLDIDTTLISYNPAAGRILDGPAIGKPIHDCLPMQFDDDPEPEDLDGLTLTTKVDGSHRTFDLSCSSMTDFHGSPIGWVVWVRDITDRYAYEQRLEVAHRILRHNLRNQMNVIHGWAKELERTGPPECTVPARHISETAAELISLSEKSDTMVATAGTRLGDPEPVDISPVIDSLLDNLARSYPDVAIETDVPRGITVGIPDVDLLRNALENLLENAVEHNDSADPRVRVTVEESEADTGFTQIQVADNGPGIAKIEQAVLERGWETQLEHGSSIGLWLVYWNVRAMQGEISFDTTDAPGSTVTLKLPTWDENTVPLLN